MAERRLVYGEVESKSDLERIFREIRKDAESARNRAGLTELYKRADYLIALTQAPSWTEKFGKEAKSLQRDAEAEFATTARAINRRAHEIGTDADYDEHWGD
jgi:hypothetical protein